jgi:ligand-binding sensor domain-containing protein
VGQVQYQTLEQMQHTSWSAADGLLGEPAALAQTSDGFLWIGTNLGLYRFDGVRFDQYRPEGGRLPAAAISVLAPAPDGGLWVGYVSGGVSRLAPDGAITTYTTADSVPIGRVRSIAVDHDGAAWVAAVGGLARLESDGWHKVGMDWNYACKSAGSGARLGRRFRSQ